MAKKYRLLVGQHIENIPGTEIEATYSAGDTFESASNLERFNSPGHSPKFERLQDDVKVGPKSRVKATPTPEQLPEVQTQLNDEESTDEATDTLESMSVAELYKFAKENDIDLGRARKKNELIEVIRKASESE